MSLTEFLLARIAEDGEPTYKLVPYACEPDCCAPADWVGSQCRYCDAAPVYGGTVEAITASADAHAELIHRRSRVLAESAAKRGIVALLTDSGSVSGVIPWERMAEANRDVLRLLSLPYADHPDYDEAWRP